MREDFSKVLVERQRGGMRGDRKGWKHFNQALFLRDADAIPSFESSSRHRGGTKYLNEHLGPLLRFLRGSVGRLWNDVHKELSVHVNRGNAVQAHVFQHLYQYVTVNTQWRGGVIVDSIGIPMRENYSQRYFYVCPTHHTLMAAPTVVRKHRRTVPSAPQRTVDSQSVYRQINGIWYQLWFEPLPIGHDARVFDVGLGETVPCHSIGRQRLLREYGLSGVFAARKRQVGKRLIKRERLDWEVLERRLEAIA